MKAGVIFEKTFRDLMSPRRTFTYIAVCLFLAILVAKAAQDSLVEFGAASLPMQTQTISGFFLILSFMWLAGVPLTMLASINGANFISKEKEDGTLALLVSKPVDRVEIIFGKLAAFFASSAILELIVLISTPLVFYFILGLDVSTFNYLFSIIPRIFLYSLFVSLIFGSLATASSAFFRSRTKTLILLVILILFVFFGFGIIRQWTTFGGLYDKYHINYIDLNYHLGNVYVSAISSNQHKISPAIQSVLGSFTGTYETLEDSYDEDIGAMPASLISKRYSSGATSLFIWIIITVMILILSIVNFRRQDIF